MGQQNRNNTYDILKANLTHGLNFLD